MRCGNPRKLHGQKIKARPIERLHIIHIRLHGLNRLPRLKCFLNFRLRFINKEKPAELLRTQLQVIKDFPGQQLAFAGGVHIRRNRNLITAGKTGLNIPQRLCRILFLDPLPCKISLCPRQIIQFPGFIPGRQTRRNLFVRPRQLKQMTAGRHNHIAFTIECALHAAQCRRKIPRRAGLLHQNP